MKKLSLLIFLAAVFNPLTYSQQNVNINEGFEGAWLPNGWQSSSFTETSTMNHTSGGSKSAMHGISIFSTASLSSEKFQVIYGEQFDTVSFWIRSSAILLSGSLSVNVTGSITNDNLGTANLSLLPIDTWVKYSYPYSPSANDSVRIEVSVSHSLAIGNIYIDDVRINKSLTLPVELAYFNHAINDNNVTLLWGTLSEINNSGFQVHRKYNNAEAGNWQVISFIPGSGTTNEPKEYSFTDAKLNSGKYYYRLKQIDYNGNFEYFSLPNYADITAPKNFELEQNYPNPSNPGSKISYRIPIDAFVTLKIYDVSGKEIKTLVNFFQGAGYHTVEFNGADFSSGVYFYRISANGYTDVKKMIIVK
jgi:hypothetical protein